MVNHLPIDGEQVARAAEEMIALHGDSALVEAGKQIRTCESGGFDYVAETWKLIREVIRDTQQSDTTTERYEIVPVLTQADRAYAIAMDGRRYEDTTRKEGVRVAKPEWGIKPVCQSCAAKCYGLSSSPIACPQCGTRLVPEAPVKSCRVRPAAPAKLGPKWR